eukprot:g8987.t1
MLKTPARVRALELQHTDLADTGTVILAEAIKVNHTVSHVALRSSLGRRSGERVASLRRVSETNSNEIGERGAEELAEALRVNKTLDTLDLGNNQLGPKGLVPLAELLRRNRNRSLRHLALGNNNIGPDAIVFLAGGLISQQTSTRCAWGLKLPAEYAPGNPLSLGLGAWKTSLVWVSRSGGVLQWPQEEHLFGAAHHGAQSHRRRRMERGPAQTLTRRDLTPDRGAQDMRLTDLGNEGCIQVAEGLKVSQALQHLDLSYNQIYDRGGVALADALRQNRSLQDLLLRTNQLGDAGLVLSLDLNCIKNQGAADLAQALTVNRSLLILRICSNEIGEQGAVALADALRQNCTLQQLIASSNLFGQHGATALGSALRHGAQQLQTLDLRSNGLGDPGVIALAEALRQNNSLQTLVVGNNHVQRAGAEALAEALKDEPTRSTRSNPELGALAVGRRTHLTKDIGDIGTTALTNALKDPNCSLQQLGVASVELTPSGRATMSEVMEKRMLARCSNLSASHKTRRPSNPNCQIQ